MKNNETLGDVISKEFENIYKQGCKDTAEKIKGFIFSKLNEATDDLTRLILREIYWQVDGFAKQFGVEINNSNSFNIDEFNKGYAQGIKDLKNSKRC